MIQASTILEVADNSGARKIQCIKVLGGSKRRSASIGDIIVVSIRKVVPNKKIRPGEVHKALVVYTKKNNRRTNGSRVRLGRNAVVLLNAKKLPQATRILGVVPRELKSKNFGKVLSIAKKTI